LTPKLLPHTKVLDVSSGYQHTLMILQNGSVCSYGVGEVKKKISQISLENLEEEQTPPEIF
jgi:alpha-tubulin suppressor-like RCC1 family protein